MTFAARGIYRELMDYQWEDGFIPENPEETIWLLKCTPAEWKQFAPFFDKCFPVCEDGLRRNARMASDREKASAKHAANQENGKRGGRPKKEGKQEPRKNHVVSKKEPNGNQVGNPDETQLKGNKSNNHIDNSNELSPPTPKGCEEIWLLLPESHRTCEMADAWTSYRRMRFQKGKRTFTDEGLAKKAKLLAGFEPNVAVAMLDESTTNEWDGIFQLKSNAPHGNGQSANRPSSPDPKQMMKNVMSDLKKQAYGT